MKRRPKTAQTMTLDKQVVLMVQQLLIGGGQTPRNYLIDRMERTWKEPRRNSTMN